MVCVLVHKCIAKASEQVVLPTGASADIDRSIIDALDDTSRSPASRPRGAGPADLPRQAHAQALADRPRLAQAATACAQISHNTKRYTLGSRLRRCVCVYCVLCQRVCCVCI